MLWLIGCIVLKSFRNWNVFLNWKWPFAAIPPWLSNHTTSEPIHNYAVFKDSPFTSTLPSNVQCTRTLTCQAWICVYWYSGFDLALICALVSLGFFPEIDDCLSPHPSCSVDHAKWIQHCFYGLMLTTLIPSNHKFIPLKKQCRSWKDKLHRFIS